MNQVISKQQTQVQAPSQKAERIFDLALNAFNNGQRYHAMQTAKYALQQARKSGSSLRVDICQFLAFLKLELGQPRLAEYYACLAQQYLDRQSPTFGSDRTYLNALLSHIRGVAA